MKVTVTAKTSDLLKTFEQVCDTSTLSIKQRIMRKLNVKVKQPQLESTNPPQFSYQVSVGRYEQQLKQMGQSHLLHAMGVDSVKHLLLDIPTDQYEVEVTL